MAEAKMVSLEMTSKEAKAEFGYPGEPAAQGKPDLPKFPYGTTLRLETPVLEKLGVEPSDFTVGESMTITVKAEVKGISIGERLGGKGSKELELQITDIAMDLADKKKAKAADKHLDEISGPSSDNGDYED